jgi:hypothetical protein
MQVINWRIVSHPLNWITVFLMVFIAAIGVHFILTYFGQVPAAQQHVNQAAQLGSLPS